ncbi:MAG: hypothetical protein IJB69_04840 [Clostridia bacterium]|nr:hypothetical protein [Clostridia bacterium]
MQRQITFRQYRAMDLFFFSLMLTVSETLITLGATIWFPGEPYTVSLSCAVMAIVMVRWGVWAAVPVTAGNLAFCLVSGAAPAQYAIYVLGSLAGLAVLPLLKKKGWQTLHDNVLFALLYGLLCALGMQGGRFLVALAFGNSLQVCAGFFTTDILSTLFSVLLVWIARKLDGMLEEQTHYLKRIQEEKEKEMQRY